MTRGHRLFVSEGGGLRIEARPYAQNGRLLLAVHFDAASTRAATAVPSLTMGPLARALIGVAEAKNRGCVIPAPTVAQFLGDMEERTFAGVPSFGMVTPLRACRRLSRCCSRLGRPRWQAPQRLNFGRDAALGSTGS